MIEYFTQNPWLNIIFILLTMLGISLTIYFYIKSKKSKKPTYTIKTINLIKEKAKKIKPIEILYKRKLIENISLTKIALWNAGTDTISKSDIANKDKFRIEIDSKYKLLDCSIIEEINKANDFSVIQKGDHQAQIDFDYFDKNEGVIIQIFHTATDSKPISLHGSFKGTKKLTRYDKPKLFPNFINNAIESKILDRKFMRKLSRTTLLVLPIVYWIMYISGIEPQPDTIFEKLTMITGLILITIFSWYVLIKVSLKQVPRNFKFFDD